MLFLFSLIVFLVVLNAFSSSKIGKSLLGEVMVFSALGTVAALCLFFSLAMG